MIGLDIVDLKQATQESNWRRKGYLEKVFTNQEQALINQAVKPEIMIWLFWSMKEAAYKVFSRELALRNYAPSRIACGLKDEETLLLAQTTAQSTTLGKVVYENRTYLTQSIIDNSQGYIQTLSACKLESLQKAVIEISEHIHPPYKQRNPASVSHHGRYLALAFI